MTAREDEVQLFNRGEKVLCYEPDESKAKVLYDSKVLSIYERKGENKQRYFDYKIHFQGWNSSWDRNVRASSLLKDSEANRELQRELAEAAQLQKSGGYSYKDTKPPMLLSFKKKRSGKDEFDLDVTNSDDEVLQKKPPQQQKTGTRSRDNSGGNKSRDNSGGNKSRDNSGGRKKQGDKSNNSGEVTMRESRSAVRADGEQKTPKAKQSLNVTAKERHTANDKEKPIQQEDRVVLRISERLREYMEYDYNMVCKLGNQHKIPAPMNIVTILENFVKQRAVELAIGIKQDSSRARNTTSRNARMEREYDRVMSNVCMLKEVVDGLRIYFEFSLENFLLYKEEKDYVLDSLEENLMNGWEQFHRAYENLNFGCDPEPMAVDDNGTSNGNDTEGGILGGVEYEKQLQKCLLYIVKNSGKNNMAHAYDQRTSPYTAAYKLPMEMRGFLCETFSWRLLSAESPPEKSMIFGAPHLARMLVKLPEFLNASPMANEKLEDLLKHLDIFINYLENHKDWFDKDVYEPAAARDYVEDNFKGIGST